MDKQAILMLVFAGFFFLPILFAVMAAWVARRVRPRRAAPTVRPVPTAEEERTIAAYHRRIVKARRCFLAGWLGGTVLIWGLDLPLTGIALLILGPLYGFVAFIRCPGCNGHNLRFWQTASLHCRYCGTRLMR
ncbi:MAG: hypothetical protein MI806_09655 [Minwuiales bacterium]|nr:hypothetical protein [Minwuiales bacterium]